MSKKRKPKMREVGSREFREKFSTFLNATDPVAITSHGQTVGFYFPVRPDKSDAELATLQAAAAQIAALLKSAGEQTSASPKAGRSSTPSVPPQKTKPDMPTSERRLITGNVLDLVD